MRAPRHRAPRHRGLAAVIAASVVWLLAAVGCSQAQDVADADTTPSRSVTSPAEPSSSDHPSTPPSTPTPPATTSPDHDSDPQIGFCYDAERRAFSTHRDGSEPVPCAAPHTAETFAVFGGRTLPDTDRLHRLRRLCATRFASYVGAPPTVSRVGMTLMEPSASEIAAGATWVRCDAIEVASFNVSIGISRTGSLRDALARTVPVALRGCANHWPKVYQAVHFTSCRTRHQAELIPEARVLGGPDAPYPGRAQARKASRTFCEAAFQRYVTSTTHFYYYYPTAASWVSSTHATTCWAVDPSGAGLPPL